MHIDLNILKEAIDSFQGRDSHSINARDLLDIFSLYNDLEDKMIESNMKELDRLADEMDF